MPGEALHAFVIGAVDLGEADRVVRLLSAAEGRGSVVCRGARSSRKRFVGVTELGVQVALTRTPRRGSIPVAAAMERLRGPIRAREDLDRLAMLAYGCELCGALAPEDAPAEKLYGLLDAWLTLLEADPAPNAASRVALEAKALTFAGLGPALVRCAVCGAPLDDPAVFDAEAGGAVHARCGGGRSVRAASLAAVEALRRTPLSDTPTMELPGDIGWLLADFVQHQLGRALSARAWWSGLS